MSTGVTPKIGAGKKKLLDQVRDVIRFKHYSIRTEETYCDWIRRFILFHGKRHPKDMAEVEVTAFLTHLAVAGKVLPLEASAGSQNLFLVLLSPQQGRKMFF